ncbi:MAG: hypothetical protein HY906_13980 [Deltaproteobacteria bacterium]|nr:hypothetical protein [Deltaproteobacteria bacterium]
MASADLPNAPAWHVRDDPQAELLCQCAADTLGLSAPLGISPVLPRFMEPLADLVDLPYGLRFTRPFHR